MPARFSTRLAAAALLAASTLLPACSDRAATPATTPTPAAPNTFDQLYTTRGVIRSLPDPARPTAELQIQHEEIPEFVNGEGETSGMRPMTMPFPSLASDVSLDGLAVGDKIRFTFGVRWTQGTSRRIPTWTITAIETLPVETELDFTRGE